MRSENEFRQNPQNRRGVVVDRDPKTMRVKVRFEDEDDTVTQWIDVVSKSSTGVSSYQMPGKDDEVWCAMDAKGEAGCIIGSRYNSKDPAAGDANEQIVVTFPGGSFILDTSTGNATLKTPGSANVEAGGDIVLKAANIVLESGSLTHNGKNIGSTHKHGGVVKGGSISDVPV